jgi:hypothetical protein
MPMLSRRPCRDEYIHYQKKVEGRTNGHKVEATAVVAADGWDLAALKRE